jgi:ATP-dependent Clp protease ATP-binding subunit ClpA
VFERFSASARSVVIEARTDATHRRDHVVGTEHLLMGLCRVDGPAREQLAAAGITVDSFETIGPGAGGHALEQDREALASLGIDLDRVVEAIEARFGADALAPVRTARHRTRRGRRSAARLEGRPGRLTFSPTAKTCLELSLREAIRLKSSSIEAQHLLLGILRGSNDRGRVALERRGIDVDRLRAAVEADLRGAPRRS